MAPKLKKPVRWFNITVTETSVGQFHVLARCAFRRIKPTTVLIISNSPHKGLKRLAQAMKRTWGA